MDIQVELEEIGSVKRKLTIEIPAENAAKEFDRVARDFKKHANLPGFRRGKAPLQLIKRRFEADIRGEVVQKLVPDSYEQAIKEKDLRPLGQPNLENLSAREGDPLQFDAFIEIMPAISLPKYKGLSVEVESTPVTVDEVENELEQLRERNAKLVSVEDRLAEEGDFVTINLKGEYLDDGVPGAEEPVSEEGVVVQLGDEQTHKSFSEGLMGVEEGDQKSFDVDYPEDYPEKKLAGRSLRFSVKVTEIKCKELPELNDEFAKDLRDFETIEELRTKIRETLEETRARNRENEVRKALTTKLSESVEFEIPEVLVEERTNERLRDLAANVVSQGLDPSRSKIDWLKIKKDMKSDVVEEVKTRMLLDAVAEQEGIEVSQEELEGEIDRIAESMQQPREKVTQYFRQENRLEGLRADIQRQKALGIIRETAKVK
jgi:trigger factor